LRKQRWGSRLKVPDEAGSRHSGREGDKLGRVKGGPWKEGRTQTRKFQDGLGRAEERGGKGKEGLRIIQNLLGGGNKHRKTPKER